MLIFRGVPMLKQLAPTRCRRRPWRKCPPRLSLEHKQNSIHVWYVLNTYICHKHQLNVGKYTMHRWCGYDLSVFTCLSDGDDDLSKSCSQIYRSHACLIAVTGTPHSSFRTCIPFPFFYSNRKKTNYFPGVVVVERGLPVPAITQLHVEQLLNKGPWGG